MVVMVPVSGTLDARWKYIVDGIPVNLGTTCMHIYAWKLCISNLYLGVFLSGWKKPENLEKTKMGRDGTCKT